MDAIAQLVRATDCGSVGRGFETLWCPSFYEKTLHSPRLQGFFMLPIFQGFFLVFFIMNQWLSFLLIPAISAFIGWFTNWVAIKMLFHPRLPYRFLGLTIQGIFPRRQAQFAAKLGKLVSEELLSFKDLETKIASPANLQKVMPLVAEQIEQFLRVKLPAKEPMLAMFLSDKLIAQFKEIFMQELEELFPRLMGQYMGSLQEQLDLEKIVTDKVSGFSSDKLEQILLSIMSKEFRFVEILGGILGFLIGLVQVLLTRL